MLATLAGCQDAREFVYEKYTGERVGDPVPGPRRPPLLNAGYTKNAPPAPAAVSSRAVPIQPKSASITPYDQYDNDGNDVSRTNYIKEWLGDDKKAPEAASAASASAAPVASGRKPFKGSVAALEPATPVVLTPQPAPARVIPPAPQIRAVPPAVIEEENGVFVPEPEQRAEAVPVQFSQLQPAAGGSQPPSYPHLADVPKVPEASEAVRKQKNMQQKSLQREHKAAMEEKKELDAEPTELPVTLPQVDGMLRDIDEAIHGPTPIVQATR
ncbi:MAG: hypothetical protein SFX19_00560 [Alphaproteobacteria bacterium]|nr:hypothetical protein [Alphaproteobacteria bacterium]